MGTASPITSFDKCRNNHRQENIQLVTYAFDDIFLLPFSARLIFKLNATSSGKNKIIFQVLFELQITHFIICDRIV